MTPPSPTSRLLLALKAARDFGLPQADADEIALDARAYDAAHHDELVDALTASLLATGAITVPSHP